MQQTDELLEAIGQYLAGNATLAQRKLVNDWYHSFDDELVTVETSDVAYEELLEARLRLRLAESTGVFAGGSAGIKQVRLWPKIAVAAAAVTAVVFGVWFFNGDRHPDSPSSRTAGRNLLNDIAPGKNGATITLANGEVIALDSAKNGVVIGNNTLVYSDGSQLLNDSRHLDDRRDPLNGTDKRSLGTRDDELGTDSKVQTLTAGTAKGQTYQFVLPDGTRVWLNADSKLEFPSSFVKSNTRNVKLTGEGYFEVAKDKAHPFVVDTRRQKVEVLGTHFNVTAYANDVEVKTTLLEGRVAVTEGGSRLTLDPGDQAYSGLDGVRALTLSNPEAEVDWKNGDFVFDNESLEQIMKKVARWYDIEVSYEPGIDKEQSFGGKVSRNKNISAVLNSMQSTGKIKFKIEGKKVTVVK